MKKISKLMFLIVATMFLLVSCSEKDKSKNRDVVGNNAVRGIVLFQVGEVNVLDAGKSKELLFEDRVNQDDVIVTGKKSSVTIQFSSIGIIRILENSKVVMKSLFSGGNGEIFIEKGEVLSKIDKLKKGTTFRIKTPTVVASVRGTEFSTGYLDGKSLVAVKSGKIAVVAKKESLAKPEDLFDKSYYTEEVIVTPGKTATLETVNTKKDEKENLATRKIDIRDMTKTESLTVEKISVVEIVPDVEKKSEMELRKIYLPVLEKDKKIDNKLVKEKKKEIVRIKKEKIKVLIKKKKKSLKEIKEVFDRIDEITLYSSRVIKGAIIARGKRYKMLTTTGVVFVQEDEIKSVRVIK